MDEVSLTLLGPPPKARRGDEIEAVCVFCGSRTGNDPAMSRAAAELGRNLAQNGLHLVYGGGSVGLMGVLARAALEAGGKVTGVIPQHLARRELQMEGLTELRTVSSLHDRKRVMFELSDAFVSLPGGIGTLDETVEIIVWRQLAIHDKPVILVDIDGYWSPFEALLAGYASAGFSYSQDWRLYEKVGSVADVVPAIRRSPRPAIESSPELT